MANINKPFSFICENPTHPGTKNEPRETFLVCSIALKPKNFILYMEYMSLRP